MLGLLKYSVAETRKGKRNEKRNEMEYGHVI